MIDAPQPAHKSSGFTEDARELRGVAAPAATQGEEGGGGAGGRGWGEGGWRRWWRRRWWLHLLHCSWQRSVVLHTNRKFRAEQEAERNPISSLPPVESGFRSSVTLLELTALCVCNTAAAEL